MQSTIQTHLHIGQAALCKCGILGCGELGGSIARALIKAKLFSELVLWDPIPELSVSEARRNIAASAFSPFTDLYAGKWSELADCGLLILTEDLIPHALPHSTGRAMLTAYTERLVEVNKGAILLIAAADSEELTDLVQRISGFPSFRVMGCGTVAETEHLSHLIGNHLGIERGRVNSFVLGAGGRELLPICSSANIAGVDLPHFCESIGRGYDPSVLESFCTEVCALFEKKETSPDYRSYAVTETVCRIAKAILQDRNEILTVCTPAGGCYGLEDVCLSLPCVIGHYGIKRIPEIPLNSVEEERLRAIAAKLRSVTVPQR